MPNSNVVALNAFVLAQMLICSLASFHFKGSYSLLVARIEHIQVFFCNFDQDSCHLQRSAFIERLVIFSTRLVCESFQSIALSSVFNSSISVEFHHYLSMLAYICYKKKQKLNLYLVRRTMAHILGGHNTAVVSETDIGYCYVHELMLNMLQLCGTDFLTQLRWNPCSTTWSQVRTRVPSIEIEKWANITYQTG